MKIALRTVSAAALIIVSLAALAGTPARAEDSCDNVAQYLWGFQPSTEKVADESDADLLPSRAKGAHAATDRAYPFPNLPASVSTSMDRDTLVKVTGLYDRYVLLERSISDLWKDRYAKNPLPAAQAKFNTERAGIYQEMSRIAKTAKDEVVRYAFRSRACFDAYEQFAMHKQAEMRQALADAKTTLHANEEIWSHAESAPTETSPVANVTGPTPVEAPRAPASVPSSH